jgi:hypothetical protein
MKDSIMNKNVKASVISTMRLLTLAGIACSAGAALAADTEVNSEYVVVDTMQSDCYDLDGEVITCGSAYVGQDAEYETTVADYTTSSDLTVVTDNNTGLMWEYNQADNQYDFDEAIEYCESQTTGGYDDWRLPSLKELYSIADFNGAMSTDEDVDSVPYIDEDYFGFEYDSNQAFATQFWSSTEYLINVVSGDEDEGYWSAFGFNFADGHIKAYSEDTSPSGLYVRCVRGDEYGVNDFSLNDNETIVTDNATGLMWQQSDGGETYSWPDALDYCENLELEGYTEWRLPDNKELQSIVKYGTTEVPAIDTDYFDITFNKDYDIDNIYGDGGDYGWFWSSTTIGDFPMNASYLAFGRAYSYANSDEGDGIYYDYHGAGAQRSDPKYPEDANDGTGCSDFACDEERGYNYVRCVHDVASDDSDEQSESSETVEEETVTTSSVSSDRCSIDYDITNEWNSGYIATITITNNNDSDISSWETSLEFSDDTEISNLWNAVLSGSAPSYLASSYSWNGEVAAGGSVTWGIQTIFTDYYEIPTLSVSCE